MTGALTVDRSSGTASAVAGRAMRSPFGGAITCRTRQSSPLVLPLGDIRPYGQSPTAAGGTLMVSMGLAVSRDWPCLIKDARSPGRSCRTRHLERSWGSASERAPRLACVQAKFPDSSLHMSMVGMLISPGLRRGDGVWRVMHLVIPAPAVRSVPRADATGWEGAVGSSATLRGWAAGRRDGRP